MFEAFQKLFSFGDTNETIALVLILLATFVLGMLFWALFVHFPKSRRLKKENKQLDEKATRFEKEYKDISERYAVQGAKLKRLDEDHSAAKANLKERKERIEQQNKEIETLKANLKEAQELARDRQEEMDEIKRQRMFMLQDSRENAEKAERALLAQKDALRKVEEMKGLIEEMEEEKKSAVKSSIDLEQKCAQLEATQRNSEGIVQMLQNDLNQAMEEIAHLKKHNKEIKDSLGKTGESSENLKLQNVKLEEENRELKKELETTSKKLDVYLEQEEKVRKEEEAENEAFERALKDAESIMQEQPFYTDFETENEKDEFIENATELENFLNEDEGEIIQARGMDNDQEPPVQLDEEEVEELERALQLADVAMNMQGFFGDIDEAILIEHEEEQTSRSLDADEDIMDRYLKETSSLIEESDFFQALLGDELVEDEEQLTRQLEKDENEMNMQSRSMDSGNQEEPVEIDPEEDEIMNRALEAALSATSAEGFYAPMDAKKLVDEKKRGLGEVDPTYKSDIEKAVVQEIGDRIPVATEAEKDDLQKIDGIGQFIEQKLNHLGIYTYKQIAHFDSDFIQKLTPAIGFSEKAIQHYKWVERAKELYNEQHGQG